MRILGWWRLQFYDQNFWKRGHEFGTLQLIVCSSYQSLEQGFFYLTYADKQTECLSFITQQLWYYSPIEIIHWKVPNSGLWSICTKKTRSVFALPWPQKKKGEMILAKPLHLNLPECRIIVFHSPKKGTTSNYQNSHGWTLAKDLDHSLERFLLLCSVWPAAGQLALYDDDDGCGQKSPDAYKAHSNKKLNRVSNLKP